MDFDGLIRQVGRGRVAQVPMKAGLRTLYARFGDVFAWACVAGVAAWMGRWLAS